MKYGKNTERVSMEVVLNFENKFIVNPNEIINFDNTIKNQQVFFAPINNIVIDDPFSSYNETLCKLEKEIIKYVEPKSFEYQNEEKNKGLYIKIFNIKILYLILLLFLN